MSMYCTNPALWSFLCMTHSGDALREPRQRERPGGKMYDEQPRAQSVDYVVQTVSVGDSVNGRVEGESKH